MVYSTYQDQSTLNFDPMCEKEQESLCRRFFFLKCQYKTRLIGSLKNKIIMVSIHRSQSRLNNLLSGIHIEHYVFLVSALLLPK